MMMMMMMMMMMHVRAPITLIDMLVSCVSGMGERVDFFHYQLSGCVLLEHVLTSSFGEKLGDAFIMQVHSYGIVWSFFKKAISAE